MNTNLKCLLKMLANSALTLFLFVLIVQFAPVSISNIFLNPLGVVKGLQYQQDKEYKKEMEQSQKSFKETMAKKREAIFSKSAPFFGSKDGKAEVVVFYDYKCGYCNALAGVLENIMKEEKYAKNVKVIARDFPILSPASALIAIASLKAFEASPEKFLQVHEALFKVEATESAIIAKIKEITGKTINLSDVNKERALLDANLSLGKDIGIRGTPAMIIGDEFIGGLISEQEFRAKLDVLLSK
jgi:protein-disulfide isomerase